MAIEIGKKFNNFTVISNGNRSKNSDMYYLCMCVCGEKRNVRKGNLGKVIGCGCKRKTYKQRTKVTITKKPKPINKTRSARVKIEEMLLTKELSLDFF